MTTTLYDCPTCCKLVRSLHTAEPTCSECGELLTTPGMTPQKRMKAQLEATGLPYKEIDVFGSQIIVTAWSDDAARRWARLLAQFAGKVRGVAKCLDQTVESKGRKPQYVTVYRVGATI